MLFGSDFYVVDGHVDMPAQPWRHINTDCTRYVVATLTDERSLHYAITLDTAPDLSLLTCGNAPDSLVASRPNNMHIIDLTGGDVRYDADDRGPQCERHADYDKHHADHSNNCQRLPIHGSQKMYHILDICPSSLAGRSHT